VSLHYLVKYLASCLLIVTSDLVSCSTLYLFISVYSSISRIAQKVVNEFH